MEISELQKDLAAAFRWTAKLNMHEGIANHFSVCHAKLRMIFMLMDLECILVQLEQAIWS